MYAAETYETFHQESGMRYQYSSIRLDSACRRAIQIAKSVEMAAKMTISPDAFRGFSSA